MLGRERDSPRTKQRRTVVKLVLALDNVFFVFVQILLRVLRMTPFVGANIFFGTMCLLLGVWVLGTFGREAPGGMVISIFWIAGGAIILATLIKGRDPAFVEKGTQYLRAKYLVSWRTPFSCFLRVTAMTSTVAVLLLAPGFLLPLALVLNGCSSYATAICLFEHEKKHRL